MPHWPLMALCSLAAACCATCCAAAAVQETVVGPAPRGEVFVSPDGRRYATVIDQNETIRVIVDGKEHGAYDWVMRHGVAFTADSRHVVYQARKDGKAFTVVGPERHRRYDEVGPFRVSANHIAYTARDGSRQLFVQDGKESPLSPGLRFVALAASEPIYFAGELGKEYLVFRAAPYKTYEQVGSVALSPAGGRIAYRALSGGKWHVVVDEAQGPPFDTIGPIIFSADGKHIAYSARDGTESVALIDHKEIARHPDITGLAINADGSNSAWIVRRARNHLVISGGIEGPVFDSIDASSIAYIGSALAYVARKGARSVLVLDGKEVGDYDRIWTSGPLRERFFAVKDGMLFQVTLMSRPDTPVGHRRCTH